MKKIAVFLALVFLAVQTMTAQTADEIINKYLTQTGGADKWAALKNVKMTTKLKVQGMEIPYIMLQKAPNMSKSMYVFQGKEIVDECFDGNEGWTTNQMTQKPEKMESETSENKKLDMDYPDPFLDYAKKGYTVTLEGEETIQGTACHKIKLTKKQIKVDGKLEDNFSYYFFDKENNVPIMTRATPKTGQMKGMLQEVYLSDYQEFNGLFFPFTIQVKVGGQDAAAFAVEKIETNVELKADEFAMPK